MPLAAEVSAVSTDAKLRLLVAALGDDGPPRVVETHMSWVFLCGSLAYKLKKPVRYDFLDFSTPDLRELNCREEVRLNRRLAPDVYLGVRPLLHRADGALVLGPLDSMHGEPDRLPAAGRAIDWLVQMRRLPEQRMLERAIVDGTVGEGDIDRLADRLARFYRQVPRVALSGDQYLQRLWAGRRLDAAVLLDPRFSAAGAAAVLERAGRALRRHGEQLAARAEQGRLCDGHGDLRPEHIALNAVPVVIDCLEFNRDLRAVDPFDELSYLALECRLLGAQWIGPRLIARCAAALHDQPAPAVQALYAAGRALLRARLALAHLLEAGVRTPERWLPQARRYLAACEQALDALPR